MGILFFFTPFPRYDANFAYAAAIEAAEGFFQGFYVPLLVHKNLDPAVPGF